MPVPLVVQVLLVAVPVIAPANVATLPEQIVWSIPAFEIRDGVMVTAKEQGVMFPAASVAWKSILVVPSGKDAPEGRPLIWVTDEVPTL